MRVEDLFVVDNKMSNMILLAGHNGLKNKITDLEIIDNPDGIHWIKTGDIVISTGYFIKKEKIDLSEWLEIAKKEGASAVCIKVDKFLKTLPKSALKKADELALPLIDVPIYFRFKVMRKTILAMIDDEQKTNNYKILETVRSISANLSSNSTIDDVITLLTKHLHNSFSIHIKQDDSNVCVYSNSEKNDINYTPLYKKRVFKNDFQTSIPIKMCNKIVGYIILSKENKNHVVVDDLLVIYFIPYLTLAILNMDVLVGINYSVPSEFLNAVLEKQIVGSRIIDLKAEEIDISSETIKYLNIIDYNDVVLKKQAKDIILCTLKNLLMREEYYLISMKNTIICVCTIKLSKILVSDLFNELKSRVRDDNIYISEGPQFIKFSHILKSYEEAKYIIKIMKRNKRLGNVMTYNESNILYILKDYRNSEASKQLMNATVLKLQKYKNEGDLLHTLDVFLKNGQNILKTSNELFIHRNTLYKRLKKIEQLTNVDLNNQDDVIKLSIALKFYDL